MLRSMSCRETTLYDVPQLLALIIAGILYLQVSPLGYNLLRIERPFGMSPSRVLPPLLDGIDVLLEELVFVVLNSHRDGVLKELLDCLGCSGKDHSLLYVSFVLF